MRKGSLVFVSAIGAWLALAGACSSDDNTGDAPGNVIGTDQDASGSGDSGGSGGSASGGAAGSAASSGGTGGTSGAGTGGTSGAGAGGESGSPTGGSAGMPEDAGQGATGGASGGGSGTGGGSTGGDAGNVCVGKGDGTYCGANVGGDPSYRYFCRSGVVAGAGFCYLGCDQLQDACKDDGGGSTGGGGGSQRILEESTSACQVCMSGACAREARTCQRTPECSLYKDCITTCGGIAGCTAQCTELFPAGRTAYTEYYLCVHANCSPACGTSVTPNKDSGSGCLLCTGGT